MFASDQLLIVGLRAAHLITLLWLLGSLMFRVIVAPPVLAMVPAQATGLLRSLRRQTRLCALLAMLTAAAWFVAEAADITGAARFADIPAAMLAVMQFTRFGHVMLLRLGLLLLSTGLIGRTDRTAAILVLAAAALQGGFGHAGAAPGVEGVDLLVSEGLHVVAAGAWLGALPPLWQWLGVLPPEAAARMSRRFSPLGMTTVLVLAGTGLLQGLDLIGSVPGLVGTEYGRAALVKIGMFALMLGLALYNRLVLSERLIGPGLAARTRFRLSVAFETAAGIMVVTAAASVASLTPALHEQPLWPFAWRPSLEALRDEDLRSEMVAALVILGLAVAGMTACLFLRQGRILAFGFLAFVLATRTSSFGLLLVDAYPTSFYASPTGFSASGIVVGQAAYQPLCAGCHGISGRGNGPNAVGLAVRPADLTAAHLLDHRDGEMFWWLSHGIDDPDNGRVMPGFERQLSAEQRWDMIDFLRARNAGVALREGGTWPAPVRAPAMPVRCANEAAAQMQDLRGKVVQVIADLADGPAPPRVEPLDGTIVVRLHLRAQDTGDCVVETPDAWGAYAVLAGISPDALAGTMFLVDPSGWLRAAYPAGGKGSLWRDPSRVAAEIQQICTTPISISEGSGHDHQH